MSDEKKIIRRLSSVGIHGNLLLSAFKLFAGIAGASSAMISDAVHSLSDVLATLISKIGAELSNKAPDEEHPYGHDKIESFATVILGAILIGTGMAIGISAVKKLVSPTLDEAGLPTVLPMIAAVVSIVSKEAMYRYTMHYATELNSSVFKADAWHHRSDALSSIGALFGIGAARLGFPAAEPVASLIICVFIVKIGVGILIDALRTLVDSTCGSGFEQQLRECVLSVPGVVGIDLLRTRRFGSSAYADLEISVDRSLSVVEAHDIAEQVHQYAESTFKDLKHIMIHVNPD